jgi:hypothetical protein
MIRFPAFALTALVAATLGLTACGGDGDGGAEAAAKASEALQRQGVKKSEADALAATAQRLKDEGFSDADAARLKQEIAGHQRRSVQLQQQIAGVARDLQAKRITEATATKRIDTLRRKIQDEALASASALEKVGALPPSIRSQVEQVREQVQSGTATGGVGPATPTPSVSPTQ